MCGSRDFTEGHLLHAVLNDALAFGYSPSDVLIEGEAAGADTLAREYAERAGIAINKFPALWEQHGKLAGPIRNREMLTKGRPNLVVAFVNKPLWESKGTANMVRIAKEAGVETLVIEHCVPA